MEVIPNPIGPWAGGNPFYISVEPLDGINPPIQLDLDSPWMTEHADYLRIPALWQLILKSSNVTLIAMYVYDGEQPYYTARHIGVTGGGTNEIVAYGIGKKVNNDIVNRMWVLPNGTFCSGDDVDRLGVQLVHQLGPR